MAVFDEPYQETNGTGQTDATLVRDCARITVVSDYCTVSDFGDGQCLCFSGIQRFEQLLFQCFSRRRWCDNWDFVLENS